MFIRELFEGEHDALHAKELEKTGFWGSAGAGCIFLARDTGRILLCHRSSQVEQPDTWGNWGGAIDPGENPYDAVKREATEETGHAGPFDIKQLYVFKSGNFHYYNFLTIVDTQFTPRLDWESQGYKWCEWGQWPSPLHFGLVSLFKDADSVRKITAEIEEIKKNSTEHDNFSDKEDQ